MSVSREAFLEAMRQVAATVTVVTTDGPAGRAGATVSAFTSLSADPPKVLVCLRTGSRTTNAVLANKRFCVNVLPEDAEDLARRFAGGQDATLADRFEGLTLGADPAGPVLPRATALSCVLEHHDIHATHALCIGAVHAVHIADEAPLAYLQGGFHVVRRRDE